MRLGSAEISSQMSNKVRIERQTLLLVILSPSTMSSKQIMEGPRDGGQDLHFTLYQLQ